MREHWWTKFDFFLFNKEGNMPDDNERHAQFKEEVQFERLFIQKMHRSALLALKNKMIWGGGGLLKIQPSWGRPCTL